MHLEKVVEVRNLSFSYPDKTKALANINLDIYKDESVAIIGPNGAGKSTMLLHLNGVLKGEGGLKVLDTEVNDGNLLFIRSRVGLVFQDPDDQLFMPTVFEDVAFGPINMGLKADEVNRRVKEALCIVDMKGFEARISHHLSFGQKKRIALATILSMNPEVLVLDEPTSNLDPRHRREFINLLNKIKLTKIIATHDLDLVLDVCERVVLLDKGVKVLEGKAKDILTNELLLKEHSLELPLSLQHR